MVNGSHFMCTEKALELTNFSVFGSLLCRFNRGLKCQNHEF